MHVFIEHDNEEASSYQIHNKMFVSVYCNDLNFQNKFKKEERENAWRIDKAFSKCSVLVNFIFALFMSWLLGRLESLV